MQERDRDRGCGRRPDPRRGGPRPLPRLARPPAARRQRRRAGRRRKLEEERARDPLFRGPSFGSISAHGPNAALPHYHATPESNRKLTGDTLYLIDSGGQYLDATTDVTRTVALGQPDGRDAGPLHPRAEGHDRDRDGGLPRGHHRRRSSTRFARRPCGAHGLDFDHGTGHGVGAYLCVHEGPARIAKAGTGAARSPA